MSIECVSTICPYCSCGCGIDLVVEDGRIIGQEPWKEHPVNQGAAHLRRHPGMKLST